MKTRVVVVLIGAICVWSCTKKADVQCFCQGGTPQNSSYDFGIQKNPSAKGFIAECDTYGVQNGLDSCFLIMIGK